MPRRPRILLADHPLHIVQRGINREPCVFADEDYQCCLHWIEEAARDCRCAIHAYVLMTNQVHLFLTPTTPGAPAPLIQSLGRRYVQYAKRHYRRSDSLWEGRYKASVVQAESYLLACIRYAELNPARAGIVADPGQYRWSSYRANGLAQPDAPLTPHSLYSGLVVDAALRRQAYRALFRPPLDTEAASEVREALKLGMPLGNERFAESIVARLGIRRNTGKRGRTPNDEPASRPAASWTTRIWILRMEKATMRNENRNVSDPFGILFQTDTTVFESKPGKRAPFQCRLTSRSEVNRRSCGRSYYPDPDLQANGDANWVASGTAPTGFSTHATMMAGGEKRTSARMRAARRTARLCKGAGALQWMVAARNGKGVESRRRRDGEWRSQVANNAVFEMRMER